MEPSGFGALHVWAAFKYFGQSRRSPDANRTSHSGGHAIRGRGRFKFGNPGAREDEGEHGAVNLGSQAMVRCRPRTYRKCEASQCIKHLPGKVNVKLARQAVLDLLMRSCDQAAQALILVIGPVVGQSALGRTGADEVVHVVQVGAT